MIEQWIQQNGSNYEADFYIILDKVTKDEAFFFIGDLPFTLTLEDNLRML